MILWWCKIYLRCQVTVLVYMGNICISGRYLSLHKLFRITEWRSYSGKWTVRRVYLAFLWCYFWWNILTSMLAALLWHHIRSLLSLAHIVRTTVKKNPKSFIRCGSNAWVSSQRGLLLQMSHIPWSVGHTGKLCGMDEPIQMLFGLRVKLVWAQGTNPV